MNCHHLTYMYHQVEGCIYASTESDAQNVNAHFYVPSIWFQVAEEKGSFPRNEVREGKAKRNSHVQSKNLLLNLESLVKCGVLNVHTRERSTDYLTLSPSVHTLFSSPCLCKCTLHSKPLRP